MRVLTFRMRHTLTGDADQSRNARSGTECAIAADAHHQGIWCDAQRPLSAKKFNSAARTVALLCLALRLTRGGTGAPH